MELDTTHGDPAGGPDTSSGSQDDGRLLCVRNAVKEWVEQLVDLSGSNRLLYFKDLRVGTLDLAEADTSARDALLQGNTTALSQLFRTPEVREAQAKRCRTIQAKAKENLEERGLQTLYIGVGMATWTDSASTSATPAAPVLLRPLRLLARGGAGEDFDFSVGEDWEFNPMLPHKVKTDFGIRLDAEQLLDSATDSADDLDCSALFAALAEELADLPGFTIENRWVVANLSYAKMPMVEDLQRSVEVYVDHPLICALAGHQESKQLLHESQQAYCDRIGLDHSDDLHPSDEYLVLDADASQSRVINLVVEGANLVVQGPPGTGKSQTIANLLATLVAHGKSVLFVAEKRAAIDAALNRLRDIELGDLVLDLHEGTASRRKLATDLNRALQAVGKFPAANFGSLQETLQRTRQHLNDYSQALHEERIPWGTSIYQLQEMLLAVPDECRTNARIHGDALTSLDGNSIQMAEGELAQWCNLGGAAIARGEVPWAHALNHVKHSDEVIYLQSLLSELRSDLLPEAIRAIESLADSLVVQVPESASGGKELAGLVRNVNLLLTSYSPELFSSDLNSLISAMSPAAGSISAAIALLVNSSYRAARKIAHALLLSEVEKKRPEQILADLISAKKIVSKWDEVSLDGSCPRGYEALGLVEQALDRVEIALADLAKWLDGAPTLRDPFDEVVRRLDSLHADLSSLQKIPQIRELVGTLKKRGMQRFVEQPVHSDADSSVAMLQWMWAHSIIDRESAKDPRINAFNGKMHSAQLRTFSDCDRDHVESGAQRVLRKYAEHAVQAQNENANQTGEIVRNAALKRKHKSVSDLLTRSPDVLLALRPCWVMSPLVVSQLLPGFGPIFDVVIFDEASQVRPAEAIAALARANQAVVAGDNKQLPPTAFFDGAVAGADGDGLGAPGDGNDGLGAVTRDMESILDAMAVVLPPMRGSVELRWHYRSRDERLIAFSNAQPTLYDWSLTTFPGADGEGCIRHVLAPFRVGGASGTASSSEEVSLVIELIREHVSKDPGKSLGVIAMGVNHAERIQEALRLARRDDPVLDSAECLSESRSSDSFFIKNLERVQGDERDSIILTVGYSKMADGRMQYRFGPLNQEGGQRRLNVAITRAREQMTVVSSFSPEEMDDSKLRAEGAKMLKRYLTYARSGGSDLGSNAQAKPALNGFEVDVRNRLTQLGIPLTAQHGVAGYWIDFVAAHPERPGEMILAIEADGASYHSSATARERDRLRQTHLERLGWRFHRIWSTDWFRDPEGQARAVLDSYLSAVKNADAQRGSGGQTGRFVEPGAALRGPESPHPERSERPKVGMKPSIADYSNAEIDEICKWIVSDTLLRTNKQIQEEMIRELGFQRRGSQIVSRINDSINRVLGSG